MYGSQPNLKSQISDFKSVLLVVPLCLCGSLFVSTATAAEFQPLAANATRLLESLDLLGTPLNEEHGRRIRTAMENVDAARLEKELDLAAAVIVTIDTERKITAVRGEAPLVLLPGGLHSARRQSR